MSKMFDFSKPTPDELRQLLPIRILLPAGMCVGMFLLFYFLPLHPWESAIYLSPILGGCAVLFFLAVRTTRIQVRNWSPNAQSVAITLPLLMSLYGAVFAFNILFDNSPAEEQTLVITKHLGSSFSRHRHYYVTFASPSPSPLPFAFSAYQDEMVARSDYMQIRPSVSRITLRLHRGFLGLPWYEDKFGTAYQLTF
jgi:hypothetical protein